jgi:hypothetical protein
VNALLTGITSKMAGSALATTVGGRIYLDEAPEGVAFPYVVFFPVNGRQVDTFKNKLDDILIQFSLFSTSKSATEITTMYNNLTALFDDAALSITGYTHIWMIRENFTTIVEQFTTPTGEASCKHWSVDYSILVEG